MVPTKKHDVPAWSGDISHNFNISGDRAKENNLFPQKIGKKLTFAFFIGFIGLSLFLPGQADKAKAAPPETKGEVQGSDRVSLDMVGGEEKEYSVDIKNVGDNTWKKGGASWETGPFLRSGSPLKHGDWKRYFQPMILDEEVSPGESVTISFSLRAPQDITGVVQQQFQLVTNNRIIPGTEVDLLVNIQERKEAKEEKEREEEATTNVGSEKKEQAKVEGKEKEDQSSPKENRETEGEEVDADFCISLTDEEREQHAGCNTALEEEVSSGKTEEVELEEEPRIRVGLFNAREDHRVKPNTHFDIYNGDDILLSGLLPSTVVVVDRDSDRGEYMVKVDNFERNVEGPVRIEPRDKEEGVMELVDHKDEPSWNPSINYNEFRDVIEFNYSEEHNEVWVINELPISSYLKGVTETTDYSPAGFKKVLATAARTYTMYHYNRGIEHDLDGASTKHAAKNFHVDATYDQVYKGYASEEQLPRYSEAVEETKGMVVTYEGEVVVTPYFSQSDGRTRSWEEVWQDSDMPWLQSVPVPEEEGEDMWGHGVGLSARGALKMIRDGDYGWKETLKYFYQDIELETVYQ